MTEPITDFRGAHAVLSNFCHAELEWMGLRCATVEHAFQAAKAQNQAERQLIARAAGPAKAKELGRKCLLRPEWEEVKDATMAALLIQKFTRHPAMARGLLATGDAELIEVNTWGDTYWGRQSPGPDQAPIGENRLGQLLMGTRDLLNQLKGLGPTHRQGTLVAPCGAKHPTNNWVCGAPAGHAENDHDWFAQPDLGENR